VEWAAVRISEAVYSGRSVRVAFSEKHHHRDLGPRLEPAYVRPANASGNAHNYPLSIAGWALAEGRIIAWPEEQSQKCDFDRINQLGKLDALKRLIGDDRLVNAPPYLARSADVRELRVKFAAGSLGLGDFYQDWVHWAPASRYSQFISVPVPIIPEGFRGPPADEYGVFNVDTFEMEPLLDRTSGEILAEVVSYVAASYLEAKEAGPQ
jgi:hypothetical protein